MSAEDCDPDADAIRTSIATTVPAISGSPQHAMSCDNFWERPTPVKTGLDGRQRRVIRKPPDASGTTVAPEHQGSGLTKPNRLLRHPGCRRTRATDRRCAGLRCDPGTGPDAASWTCDREA